MNILKEHTGPIFSAEVKNTRTSNRLHGIITPAMTISTATTMKIYLTHPPIYALAF